MVKCVTEVTQRLDVENHPHTRASLGLHHVTKTNYKGF